MEFKNDDWSFLKSAKSGANFLGAANGPPMLFKMHNPPILFCPIPKCGSESFAALMSQFVTQHVKISTFKVEK